MPSHNHFRECFRHGLSDIAFASQIEFLEERYEQMRHAARDLIFGRTVLAGSDIQEVALTYDDGPNDPYTQQLLDLLARYQVRATFFLIGSFVRRRPEIVRAIRQGGHLLGNHTMTHPYLRWEQLARPGGACGLQFCHRGRDRRSPGMVRPPFGGRRPGVLRVAEELGLRP